MFAGSVQPQPYLNISSKTINAAATTASVVPFRWTGVVRVKKLYGIVTTGLGANHTAAHFRTNDQTAQIALTAAAGSALSGFEAGSFLGRCALAATAITVKRANAAGLVEPVANYDFTPVEFIINAKNAVNNDIEYRYTTTDNPTSGVIQFFCEWEPVSIGAGVTSL